MSASTGTPGSAYGGPAYRWYVVGILTIIYACHALDRGLPNILVEPVKAEFNLSDSQLGLFSGLAFGVAFSTAVLPMGFLSDRVGNRRNMLAIVVVAWSILTAVGGMARNFGQLLASRIGMGVAEAGTAPLTMPMLSDIFPPARRAFALGIFYISQPAGAFVATALGGYIAQEHGWRAAFFVAGVPGLIAAVLLYLTVRDPKRGGSEGGETAAEKPASLGEAFGQLVRQPALVWLIAACTIFGLLNITLAAWMSSFFIRVHHLGLAQTGVIIGAAAGISSVTSPPIFGWLADKLSTRDPRWSLRLLWIGALATLGLTLCQLYTPSLTIAITAFALADMMRMGYAPPAYSVLMSATPSRMRGSVMSMVQLTTNFMGFAVGPVLTGALSDAFGGGAAIRHAMATVSLLFVPAVIFFILASRALYGPKTAPAAA